MVTRYRATVEDYLAMREEAPYNEYVDGEIVPKAMPDWFHGLLVHHISQAFAAFGQGRGLPEIRIRFATERGREFRLPDYAHWMPGKPHRDGRIGLPPTLAVEVRSPEESRAEQRAKCRYYRHNGVDVAWLVDPESRTVEAFDEGRDGDVLGKGDVLTSPALPGFELRLANLFAVLDDE